MKPNKFFGGFVLIKIGILLFVSNCASSALAALQDKIKITPPDKEITNYVNTSFLVTCKGAKNIQVRWESPKGVTISSAKGRVHTEDRNGSLALIFEPITLADKGNWSCVWIDGKDFRNSFEMIVYEPISFVDTPPFQSGRENRDTNIRCEVRGTPEPTVSWFFNGQLISFPHDRYVKMGDGLLIKNLTKANSGEYTCKAYQISERMTTFQEKIIRFNVQHKPIQKVQADITYGFLQGYVNLTCEAEAEPAANFTWYRNKKRITPGKYQIHSGHHVSMLQVFVNNNSDFGVYECQASNDLGSLKHVITLQEGIKPDPPSVFIFRGVNYDTLDVDVGTATARKKNESNDMETIGYRFQVISVDEFHAKNRKWSTASQFDFPFQEDMTYLLTHLKSGTKYFVRVATQNRAGYSEFTEPKEFTTHQIGNFNAGNSLIITQNLSYFGIFLLLLGSTLFNQQIIY